MNKLKRNVMLSLISALAVICMIISAFGFINSSKVYAEGSVAGENEFYVQDGAYVRANPNDQGHTGIRFTTVISDSFYNSHSGDTWGIIWGKNLAEPENLTYENAERKEEGLEPTESGNYRVMRTVIYFDEVEDAEKAAAYNTDITVRAFVKDSSEDIIYAHHNENENTRSAKEVAEAALLVDGIGAKEFDKDSNSEIKRVLLEYANTPYVENKTTEAYIKKSGETYNITGVDGEFEGKTLYFNDYAIVNNYSSGAISGLTNVGDMTLGEYYSLAYVDDNGCVVQQPVQYVTDIITNDNIVDLIQKKYFYKSDKVYNYDPTITGGSYTGTGVDLSKIEMPYYVLSGDVTFTKDLKSGDANNYGYGATYQFNPIFHGVLDGKGYTITVDSNDTQATRRLLRGGVFGYLAEGSKIKNVELLFACRVNTLGNAGAIGFNLLGDNVIENVVISIADFSFNNPNVTRPLVAGTINNAEFKDVFINVYYIGLKQVTSEMVGIGGGLNGATFDNVHILLPSDFATDTSAKKVVAKNSDETIEYYAEATDYPTAVEGITYQTLENVTVYEEKTDVQTTIGIWTVVSGKTVASDPFAQSQYKTIATVKEAFYSKHKVGLKEEVYLQADGKLVGLDGAFTSVIIDGVSYPVTEGVVEGFNGTLGDRYCIEYTIGDITYASPVQYVTDVITSNERITKLIAETYYYDTDNKVIYEYNSDYTKATEYASETGTTLPTLPYYVLGENVTFTKEAGNPGYGNDQKWNPIFHGILDGKGHTITFATDDTNNAKRTLSGGMFNYLSEGSALTNVEFLFPKQVTSNGKNSGLSSGAIAKEFLGNNRLENVVISINNVAFTGSGSQALVANVLNDVTMQDVVINVKTMPSSTELDVIGIGGGLTDGYSFENVRIYTNSAYSGSAGFALIADISGGLITNADYEVDGITVSNLTDNTTTEATTVGTWSIDTTGTTNIGADAMAGYVSEEFKAENLSTTNKTVSVEGGTFKVDKLFSSNGVYIGAIRFSIATEGIVSYDIKTNTFTAIAVGETIVNYSYIIDGVVYVKQFTVTVA